MNTKTELLKEIYDNDWEMEESDAKDMGMEYHLEFLKLISSGILEPGYNNFGVVVLYRISEHNRREVLEFLIREYDE